MINIGVVGYGYSGSNLVRNFMELSRANVAAVADQDPKKLEIVSRRYPSIKATRDFGELPRDPGIDAIAVATPVSTNSDLGMAVLRAGKHLRLKSR